MDTPARPREQVNSTRGDALVFVGIAAFAFVLRFVHLLQARSVPIFDALLMDGRSYSTWADRIVAGDWVGDRIFYQAPLYPYFLAVVKLAVGNDLARIRLVQIAIGSVACGILFLAGRSFFSRAAGIVAGVLLAIYPPAIFFDGLIQKANLGLLWTVLLLWSLARARTKPSGASFAIVGGCLGLLMLTREETLLLALVIGPWAFFASSGGSRPVLAFLGGLVLVLLPVAIRNKAVGGEFVLTTSQAGSNFYIGNNPRADGTYVPLVPGRQNTEFERKDAFDLAERDLGRTLTASEVSSYWFGKSWAWISADPAAWARLLGRKISLFLNGYEMPDYEDLYFYERTCGLLRALDSVWHYGILLPLAAAGIVLTFARRKELLILYLVLGTLAFGVVLFYVFARYRYPVVPVLTLFAGASLTVSVDLARDRRWRTLALAVTVLLAAAVAANVGLHAKDDHLAASLSNSASVMTEKHEDEKAVEYFRQSLELQPGDPEVLGNLGLALMRLKRFDAAIVAFRRATALRPEDSRAWLRLGSALDQTGKVDEATPCIVRALDLDAKGTLESARIAVRQTNGHDLVALDLLAAAQAKNGQFSDAVATASTALSIPPPPGQESLAARIRERLELYRQGKVLTADPPR